MHFSVRVWFGVLERRGDLLSRHRSRRCTIAGIRITFYEPDAYDRQQHRDIEDPPWARVVVYANDEDAALHALEAARRDADLIVKASGVGVFDELLEAAVLEMKEQQNWWHSGMSTRRPRSNVCKTIPLIRFALIPRYDLIFTYGGGRPVVRGLRNR